MKRLLITITILAFLFILTAYFYTAKTRLKPLPTKENHSPAGLYTDLPTFKEWVTYELRDGAEGNGSRVLTIKVPSENKKYILGLKKFDRVSNFIGSYAINSENFSESYKNIDEYFEATKSDWLMNHAVFYTKRNIGKYRALERKDTFSGIYESNYYILTKKNTVVISFDNDPTCSRISNAKETDPAYFQECLDYMKIYLPIVEKALSTLEIPDYVDNRGFATSTEIKLLPDELRVYEVK